MMETSWSMVRLSWRYADVTSPSRELHRRHEPSPWAEVMSSPERTVIAVAAGLAAGCSFGTGVALQYRQAQLARGGARTPVRLLAHLARQRLWLAGNALGVAGYGFLALALAFAPLALVARVAPRICCSRCR
jgi:hypothetical protein